MPNTFARKPSSAHSVHSSRRWPAVGARAPARAPALPPTPGADEFAPPLQASSSAAAASRISVGACAAVQCCARASSSRVELSVRGLAQLAAAVGAAAALGARAAGAAGASASVAWPTATRPLPAACAPIMAPWRHIAPADLDAVGAGSLGFYAPAWAFSRGPPATDFSPVRAAGMPDSNAAHGQVGHDGLGADKILATLYFSGLRGGVVLESGAIDGVELSISHYLAHAHGWRAVHIEANPFSYAALVKNRPDALNINAALCADARAVHYAMLDPADPRSAGVRAMDGILEFQDGPHKEAWATVLGAADADHAFPIVPCRPAAPLLRLFDITHVHAWVLDVEGAEPFVISAFNFSLVVVDVLVVEQLGPPEHDERVRSLLDARGFDMHRRHDNDEYFVRRGFTPCADEDAAAGQCAPWVRY